MILFTLISPYRVAVLSSSNGRKPFKRAYNSTPRLQTSAFGPMYGPPVINSIAISQNIVKLMLNVIIIIPGAA